MTAVNPPQELSPTIVPGERPPTPARAVGIPVPNPTPETARGYAADWRDFTAWCRSHHLTPLPAHANTLAAYLLARAPNLSQGTLGRRRAAVTAMHRLHGLCVPALDNPARAALRQAARRPPKSSLPLPSTIVELRQLAARCPRDLAGLRDRALLLLVCGEGQGAALDPLGPVTPDPDPMQVSQPGIADNEWASRATPLTGFQGAEPLGLPHCSILGLDAEHVRFVELGVTLRLRVRTDEEEPSRTVIIGRAGPTAVLCPVRELEDWLRASDTLFGPVFRKIDRWGNVDYARLGPDAWRQILRRRLGGRAIQRQLRPTAS